MPEYLVRVYEEIEHAILIKANSRAEATDLASNEFSEQWTEFGYVGASMEADDDESEITWFKEAYPDDCQVYSKGSNP